jgi:hypothetical protein
MPVGLLLWTERGTLLLSCWTGSANCAAQPLCLLLASLQQFAHSASSRLALSGGVVFSIRGIHGVHVALVSTELEQTASNLLKAKASLHAFDGLYGPILPGEYFAQYIDSLV